ncbi:MAG: alanine--tRNA ligase-related protein [Gemmatimonadetes bacterium]|nr:alanine--tRNA ligase-related protein [Gemmatimonadota bacterium]
MTTERLYFTDAYATEFSGKVLSVENQRVVLDRTAFYPTSGGQQFDTGVLGGVHVVDVIDDESGIVHVLESAAPMAQGSDVSGAVGWPRRFDHMQQHTGQHLLSALFEDLCGAATVSVHFGADSCTLDVNAESLSTAAVVRVEERANAVVAENRVVAVSFEDAASAAGLRKPSDRAGELRVVSIEGIDRSACGGTHVRATGEIGAVLVRKIEKYKKLSRVEFLCGSRATRQARSDFDALGNLAATLTAGIAELPRLVATQADAVRSLESERKKLTEALATFRARESYDAAMPDADGVRRVVVQSASADELRALALAVAALPRAAFIGTCDSPPTVMFAASDDSGVDAGAVLKPLLAEHGGRGGGNAKIAQGTVPDAAAIQAVARTLRGPPTGA